MPLNQKTQGRVGREAPKYLLRLPQELRDYLAKEANLNGRSVNSEIIHRLELSRQRQLGVRQRGYAARQPEAEYVAGTDSERALLNLFRRLVPEKQLALLSLFK